MAYPSSSADYNATQEHEGLVQRSTPRDSIGKCPVITMLCFVASAYVAIITMLFIRIGRPQPPSFDINYFAVSNFNATVPGFTGDWVAGLTAKNRDAKVYVNQTELFVYYYENVGILGYEEHLLGSAVLQPFFIEEMERVPLEVNVSVKETDIAKLKPKVIDEMARKTRSGAMEFSFEMQYFTTHEIGKGRSHKSYSGQYWYHCRMNVAFEEDVAGFGHADYGDLWQCNYYENF